MASSRISESDLGIFGREVGKAFFSPGAPHELPPMHKDVRLSIERDYDPATRYGALRITARRAVNGEMCHAAVLIPDYSLLPIGVATRQVLDELAREIGKRMVFG